MRERVKMMRTGLKWMIGWMTGKERARDTATVGEERSKKNDKEEKKNERRRLMEAEKGWEARMKKKRRRKKARTMLGRAMRGTTTCWQSDENIEMDEQKGNEERKREEDMTQWKWRDNVKQRNSHSRRGKFCILKADSQNVYFRSVGNLCLLEAGCFVSIQQTVREVNCFASHCSWLH